MAIRLAARTASGDITDGITQSGRQTAVASRTGDGREAGEHRIWSKDFILVMVIATLASTAITTQMGTLPLYVASLGGSTAVSGAIVGILGISALIFRVPTGVLLDRYGRRVLLVVGLAIAFIGSGLTHGGFTGGEFVLAVIEGPALLVWLAVNIIIGLFGGTL